MKKQKIRVGILGVGRVVQSRLVEVFRDELQGVEVNCICDIVKERADKVAKDLSTRAVYHIDELLSSKDVDVVFIATESGNHYKHSKLVLDAGKHVIVEKPPAMLPQQIIEIEAYAKERKLMYAVIFQNRYNPAMKALKKAYESGRFGKLVLATIRLRWCRFQEYYNDGWHGTWKMDGGVINQQGIHHIDALQWVCGSVQQVSCMQANVLNELEAEDTTVATVRFENGGLGVIEATTAARPIDFEASMSVVGEKGSVVIGGIALNKIEQWTFVDMTREDKEIPKQYSQEVPTGYGLSHGLLLQDIFDRLHKGESTPPIKGQDTIATIKLVHALYCSAELNSPVNLSDNKLSKLGIDDG